MESPQNSANYHNIGLILDRLDHMYNKMYGSKQVNAKKLFEGQYNCVVNFNMLNSKINIILSTHENDHDSFSQA